MWTYSKARDFLAQELAKDAAAQESGRPDEIGTRFDALDEHLPRINDPKFEKLHIALNFWGGWIDARNHDWQYYEPIRREDWPRLARDLAAQLNQDREPDSALVLEHFDLRKQRRCSSSARPRPQR